MRALLTLGYEMLTADRGWWAAQDPFDAANADGPATPGRPTLREWAGKVMRNELDVWFYLPADDPVPEL